MSSEVTSYLRQHQKTIAPLHKDYSLRFWDLSLAGNNREFEKALVESKERYLKVYNNREEFRQLREWKHAHLQLDEFDGRLLKVVHDAFLPNQIDEHVLREIVERET